MWAIYKKELRGYLLSPVAWTIWVMFTFLNGYAYMVLISSLQNRMFSNPDLTITDAFLGPLHGFARFLLLLICPILTMKLFAEEKQTGTLELLFTYPLTEVQMLGGKVLAALTTALLMLGLTLPPLVYLSFYTTIDWAMVGTAYLGFLLLMGTFLTIGIWASSLTSSQAVAFGVSFGLLLLLWLLNALQGITWALGPVGSFLREFALLDHYESFSRGVISSNDVIFYLSLMAFFLFLTSKQLESRKWRG